MLCYICFTISDKNACFTSEQPKRYKLWSCQKKCDALHYLLDNIFIRFGSKLYRQIVGIPMGTNCAPLVAGLFLFCYERDFMLSLSDNNQTDIIEAFNCTSRYLDDLLNIDYFWKRCFLKTSVSNGIIYTKYTQNPHTIEPLFNITIQSASLDRYSLYKSLGTK